MSVRSTLLAPSEGTPIPAAEPRHSTVAYAANPDGNLLPLGMLVNGRYRIERVLGAGGMATVYLARHTEIGARLAIKVLHRSLAENTSAAEHFLNEARGVSRIQHPHVVAVSDYGKLDDGVPYMVMEYLNGEDLESILTRDGPLPWSRVRTIARQICEALGAAHLQGVVHRDVKPQNCLRQEHAQFGDFIKVLDFGIAQVGEDAQLSSSRWARTPRSIVGTPEYMAPEVGAGGEVDHRADVYSLGVTLFSLLTGRLPFESKDAWEQIEQHQTVDPPAPSAVAPPEVLIDPRVDALVLRAMAKKPSDRYPSMASFAEAIDAIPAQPIAVTLSTAPLSPSDPEMLAARQSARHRRNLVVVGAVSLATTVTALALVIRFGGPTIDEPEPPAIAPAAAVLDPTPTRDPEPPAADAVRDLDAPGLAPDELSFEDDSDFDVWDGDDLDAPAFESPRFSALSSDEPQDDAASDAPAPAESPQRKANKKTASAKPKKVKKSPAEAPAPKRRYTGPLRNPYE